MLRSMKVKFTAVFLIVLLVALVSFSSIIYGLINSEYYRETTVEQIQLMRPRRHANFPGADDMDKELIEQIQEYFREQEKARYNQLILTLLIPTLLISGGLAYVTAYYLVRPIDELADEVNVLGDGDFSRRLDDIKTDKEVEYLRESFNDMLDKVEEAFNSQEEFISDAAHELRTPLASMRANLSILKKKSNGTSREIEEGLDALNRMSEKLIKLSEDLLYLDRRKVVKKEQVFLSDLVDEVLEMLNGLIKENGVTVRTKYDYKGKIKADQKALARALENLIENAIKYGAKSVNIKMWKKDRKFVALTIKDDGMGIDQEDLEKIFDRFYRGDNRDVVDGTGLGLSIVKKIVEDHRGTIQIESNKGKGTKVRVELPRS